MSEREMTLEEWVERLPEIHRARKELGSLFDRISTLESRLEKARECIGKYRRAIDAIYNHNEATRAAVVQHFGVLHPADAEILALRKTEASGE